MTKSGKRMTNDGMQSSNFTILTAGGGDGVEGLARKDILTWGVKLKWTGRYHPYCDIRSLYKLSLIRTIKSLTGKDLLLSMNFSGLAQGQIVN